MCAVCTGHVLLLIEAPLTREQNKGTGQENQHNPPTQQEPKQTKQSRRDQRSFSLYSVKRTAHCVCLSVAGAALCESMTIPAP